MGRARTVRRVLAGIGIVLGLAIIASVGYMRQAMFPDTCRGQTTFSEEEWARLAEASIGAPDRACLVDDLLSRGLLRGRTQLQVAALLGPPSPGERPDPGYDAIYYLGPERGPFGIDSQWLQIAFDSTGHVARADRHTD